MKKQLVEIHMILNQKQQKIFCQIKTKDKSFKFLQFQLHSSALKVIIFFKILIKNQTIPSNSTFQLIY